MTVTLSVSFFFNPTATTDIYTLSLHDALPISISAGSTRTYPGPSRRAVLDRRTDSRLVSERSEEHTSELQSRFDLVCRLLLEKKKRKRAARACRLRCGRALPRAA